MMERLRERSIIGYGLGELANQLLFAMGATYLLLYYTQVVGLSLGSMLSTIVSIHVCSLVVDVLIGHTIDRVHSHWGQYRPFLLFGPIPLLIGLYLLFAVPLDWGTQDKILYVAFTYAFFILCYSLVAIPHGALAAAITKNRSSRVLLGVARMIATSAAYVCLWGVGLYASAKGFDLWMVLLTTGGISYFFYLCCFALIKEQKLLVPNIEQLPSKKTLGCNIPLWILCLSSLGILTANFVLNVAYMLYVQHLFGQLTAAGWLLGIQMAVNFILSAFVPYIVRVLGSKFIFLFGCIVAWGGCTSLFFFASSHSLAFGLGALFVASVGLGLAQTVLWPMEADTVDYAEYKWGIRRAGVNFAYIGIMRKMAQLLANLMPMLLLAFLGYAEFNNSGVVEQFIGGEELSYFVRFMLSLMPAFAILVSLILMLFYPLGKRAVSRNLDALKARYDAIKQVDSAANTTTINNSNTASSTSDESVDAAKDNASTEKGFVSRSRYARQNRTQTEQKAKLEPNTSPNTAQDAAQNATINSNVKSEAAKSVHSTQTVSEELQSQSQPQVQAQTQTQRKRRKRVGTGRIIGLDLGTTNSVVAVYDEKKINVLDSSEGYSLTPSHVTFIDYDKCLIGSAAQKQILSYPKQTIWGVNRFLGERYDDCKKREGFAFLPFTLTKGMKGAAWIDVNGNLLAPSEIAAEILKNLKFLAEEHLDEEVTGVVLTCPVGMNQAQRMAWSEAAGLAGLEVKRLLSSPAATALAYGAEQAKGEQSIMVYDFGGGHFNCGVFNVDEIDGDSLVEILAESGDLYLGGCDLDNCIINFLLNEGIHNSRKQRKVLLQDQLALHRLKEAAEKAKISLSSSTSTSILLPYLITEGQSKLHLQCKLTDTQLESLTKSLVERTIEPMKQVLNKAHLSVTDIDRVILVGGQSRMPLVQKTVSDFFLGKEPYKALDFEKAGAMGAALQAAVLAGEQRKIMLIGKAAAA